MIRTAAEDFADLLIANAGHLPGSPSNPLRSTG